MVSQQLQKDPAAKSEQWELAVIVTASYLPFWITSTLKYQLAGPEWIGLGRCSCIHFYWYQRNHDLKSQPLRQNYCIWQCWHTMYWGVGREELLQAAARLLFKLIASSLPLQDHAQQFVLVTRIKIFCHLNNFHFFWSIHYELEMQSVSKKQKLLSLGVSEWGR